jgi:hypothetical protein
MSAPFDPLVTADGTAVDAGTWPARRDELRDLVVERMYGGLPPMPQHTTSVMRCDNRIRGTQLRFLTLEVRAQLEAGEIAFPLQLWIPPGEGPFPVVLCGDACWRSLSDDVVQRITSRGFIAAAFDRTALAADNKEIYRDTGLYRLLPDATFGALGPWAWGYHRCVDVLTTLDVVRQDAIAITGHSRGGKTVLLAGATDERIALTNPNASGTGGVAPNHRKAIDAEVVADFFRSGNIFWFGADYAAHRDRDADFDYEQHWLVASLAPRWLLVTEGHDDRCANPPGAYASLQAARPVFELLGVGERIGWSYREGGHAHSPEDFEALLAFMERAFLGRQVPREFQRPLFPDLDDLLADI